MMSRYLVRGGLCVASGGLMFVLGALIGTVLHVVNIEHMAMEFSSEEIASLG
jgi:hypothetical protein